MPQVSIIIPTYKHRDYVRQTLDSVFAQTFTDYEVIVINDGSPDDTADVLRPLVEAGRIQYVEQANAGQSAARNRGLALARGKYIALLDDDDLWPADKLEWQVALLEANPDVGLAGGSMEAIDANGERTGLTGESVAPATFESLLCGNSFWSPGQTLVRADLLRQVGGMDERIWGADDLDLWLRLRREAPFLVQPRVALQYRMHAASASQNMARMLRNLHIVLQTHLQYVPRSSRRQASLAAYAWLYGYIGHKFAREMRHNLWHGQLRLLCRNAIGVVVFARPARMDRKLCRQVLADLLPSFLR